MFSSPRFIASGFGLAFALSAATLAGPIVAQAGAQDTTHKGMHTPVGDTAQKKKALPEKKTAKKPMDSARAGMPGMKAHSVDDMMIGPIGVSMERMGSGTTWIPDAVTLPSRRRMLGDWMLMAHGFVFAQYDKQSGERGDD